MDASRQEKRHGAQAQFLAKSTSSLSFFFFFSLFLELYPWHMEVPRLRAALELQLPVYTTVTATRDPSHICDPCCSLWQRQILNLLSRARHQTLILRDTRFFTL